MTNFTNLVCTKSCCFSNTCGNLLEKYILERMGCTKSYPFVQVTMMKRYDNHKIIVLIGIKEGR